MKKIALKSSLALALVAVPFLAFADTTSGTVGGKITTFINFLNASLVPLIFAVAFIVFLYFIFQYFILGSGNEEKLKEGRMFLLYSIIGFVVMLSIWGIVNLFYYSLDFGSQNHPNLPTFGTGSGNSSSSSNSPVNNSI